MKRTLHSGVAMAMFYAATLGTVFSRPFDIDKRPDVGSRGSPAKAVVKLETNEDRQERLAREAAAAASKQQRIAAQQKEEMGWSLAIMDLDLLCSYQSTPLASSGAVVTLLEKVVESLIIESIIDKSKDIVSPFLAERKAGKDAGNDRQNSERREREIITRERVRSGEWKDLHPDRIRELLDRELP